MINKYLGGVILFLFLSGAVFSQQTHVFIDAEKDFKEAKQLFTQQQFALAYPLLQAVKQQQQDNQKTNATYLYDDVSYYYTVCRLKLLLPVAAEEATQYIDWINNAPRS